MTDKELQKLGRRELLQLLLDGKIITRVIDAMP